MKPFSKMLGVFAVNSNIESGFLDIRKYINLKI